jgi:hypothetical protein
MAGQEHHGQDNVVPASNGQQQPDRGDTARAIQSDRAGFMRSCELEHHIDKWQGSRTVAVLFTKAATVDKRKCDCMIDATEFADPRSTSYLPLSVMKNCSKSLTL